MKKSFSKILYSIPLLVTTGTLVTVISCSSNKGQTNNNKMNDFKTNLNLSLKNIKGKYFIDKNSSKSSDFTDFVKKYKEDLLQKEFKDTSKFSIPNQKGSLLLRNADEFSGYPDTIKSVINFNDGPKEIVWKQFNKNSKFIIM